MGTVFLDSVLGRCGGAASSKIQDQGRRVSVLEGVLTNGTSDFAMGGKASLERFTATLRPYDMVHVTKKLSKQKISVSGRSIEKILTKKSFDHFLP